MGAGQRERSAARVEDLWARGHRPDDPVLTLPQTRGGAVLKTRVVLLVVDLAVIGLAALLAVLVRSHIANLDLMGVPYGLTAFSRVAAPQMVITWILALAVLGAQSPRATGAGSTEYQRVLSASAVTAGLVGVGAYLTQYPLSRGFFVFFFALGVPMLVAARHVLRRAIHRAHTRGFMRTRVLVAGSPGHIDDLTRVLRRESWLGHEVVGALTPAAADLAHAPAATPGGVPVVGHPMAVSEALERTRAEAIVFTEGAFRGSADFRRTQWELETRQAQMIVVPALSDISRQRLDLRPVAGLPLVYVEPPQAQAWAKICKRAFDVVVGSLLIAVLAPVALLVAVAVKVDDGGPVLFRQTRVGRNGALFSCLKFRSMTTGAHESVGGLRDVNEADGLLFKLRTDPRVTRVGRPMRRYSLDELPQLFNVVRGEMSLVGPRPPLPSEVEQYSGDVVRRLRVRPGMTGLWQVSGRSDLSWADTVRLDLYYADNWSIAQDLLILARTAQAVISGRGAY